MSCHRVSTNLLVALKFFLLMIASCLTFAIQCNAQHSYELEWIGEGRGPTQINNSGQVVGRSSLIAWTWTSDDGISFLDGPLPRSPEAINDTGMIAGTVARGSTNLARGAIWNSQTAQLVHIVDPPPGSSIAETSLLDINDAGFAVGFWSPSGTSATTGIVWTAATGPVTVSAFTGGAATTSIARATNELGEIAAANGVNGYVWNPTTGVRSLERNDAVAVPFALSDSGHAAGFLNDGGIRQAAHWDAMGNVVLLAQVENFERSEAFDINGLNQVVGFARNGTSSIAAYWDQNGQFFDLNELVDPTAVADGSILTRAFSINDFGQIVGIASRPDGSTWGFQLTVAVPEPSTTFGLLIAGSMIALRRRTRPK